MAVFKVKKAVLLMSCPICLKNYEQLEGRVIPIFCYTDSNGKEFLSVEFCYECAKKIAFFINSMNNNIKPDDKI